MKPEVAITSQLGVEHLDDLQELMYFNRQQGAMVDSIVRSIDQYGSPTVYADGPLLRIQVGDSRDAQALYALELTKDFERLVGVMVYARANNETLVLLHIGVDEDYSASGEHSDVKLVMKLVLRLRSIARSIKGVTFVEIPYNPKGARIVSV